MAVSSDKILDSTFQDWRLSTALLWNNISALVQSTQDYQSQIPTEQIFPRIITNGCHLAVLGSEGHSCSALDTWQGSKWGGETGKWREGTRESCIRCYREADSIQLGSIIIVSTSRLSKQEASLVFLLGLCFKVQGVQTYIQIIGCSVLVLKSIWNFSCLFFSGLKDTRYFYP